MSRKRQKYHQSPARHKNEELFRLPTDEEKKRLAMEMQRPHEKAEEKEIEGVPI